MRVPQLPARLVWSHNTWYHRWLLRRVPERVGTALDVGCGTGRLACTLARRADRVDAVDVSAAMIAAVSSLHHLPLDAGLERLVGLVRPGGVLLVVGHRRPQTLVDRWWDVAALPTNAVVGAVLALVGRAGGPDDDGMPVCPPDSTLAEVRRAVAVLPGATIDRGLFWRHLLVWRRPPGR